VVMEHKIINCFSYEEKQTKKKYLESRRFYFLIMYNQMMGVGDPVLLRILVWWLGSGSSLIRLSAAHPSAESRSGFVEKGISYQLFGVPPFSLAFLFVLVCAIMYFGAVYEEPLMKGMPAY